MLRNVRNFCLWLTMCLLGVLLIIPVGLIRGLVAAVQAMCDVWWPVLGGIRSTGWIEVVMALLISIALFVFVLPHGEVAY